MTDRTKDDFLCGMMAALGHIYEFGQETIAEEVVKAAGTAGLLRVAKANDDIFLPDLRKTVNTLRSRRRTASTSQMQ